MGSGEVGIAAAFPADAKPLSAVNDPSSGFSRNCGPCRYQGRRRISLQRKQAFETQISQISQIKAQNL